MFGKQVNCNTVFLGYPILDEKSHLKEEARSFFFIALAFCLWNSNIAFPSLLEQEFTADPELATPLKDSITWHFFIHTEELVRN